MCPATNVALNFGQLLPSVPQKEGFNLSFCFVPDSQQFAVGSVQHFPQSPRPAEAFPGNPESFGCSREPKCWEREEYALPKSLSEGIHEVKFPNNLQNNHQAFYCLCTREKEFSSTQNFVHLAVWGEVWEVKGGKLLGIEAIVPFPCRLTPSVPFTTRTIDTEMVLGNYVLPKGVSQFSQLVRMFFHLLIALLMTEAGHVSVSN